MPGLPVVPGQPADKHACVDRVPKLRQARDPIVRQPVPFVVPGYPAGRAVPVCEAAALSSEPYSRRARQHASHRYPLELRDFQMVSPAARGELAPAAPLCCKKPVALCRQREYLSSRQVCEDVPGPALAVKAVYLAVTMPNVSAAIKLDHLS